jgi:hypothetical protein
MTDAPSFTSATPPDPADAAPFLAFADALVAALAERHRPEEIRVVRVLNWFDHKWLGWGSTGSSRAVTESAQFPAFTPNRIVTERAFLPRGGGRWAEAEIEQPIHRDEREHSARTSPRRVADFGRSAVFVWFSSGSAPNGRGSVMAYTVDRESVGGWYASFLDDGGWRLGGAKGILSGEIETMLGKRRFPRPAASRR